MPQNSCEARVVTIMLAIAPVVMTAPIASVRLRARRKTARNAAHTYDASDRGRTRVRKPLSGLSDDFCNEYCQITDDYLNRLIFDAFNLIEGYTKRSACLRGRILGKGTGVKVWATFKRLPIGGGAVDGASVEDGGAPTRAPSGFPAERLPTLRDPDFRAVNSRFARARLAPIGVI